MEEIDNREINDKEILLLKELDSIYEIPKLLGKDSWQQLSEFEEEKMTYIIKQQISVPIEQTVVIKMRQNIYGQKEFNFIENFNEVIHESFIGLFGISKLTDRTYGKHFAKIIAAQIGETCPPSIKQFSHYSNPCSYVVYEYIPGLTLNKFLHDSYRSTESLNSVYLQLIEALNYAYKTIDFTHYDLHLDNIIVTENNENPIPVIIDYGSSHIKHRDENFGREMIVGRIANHSLWAHDIIKVLMMSLLHLRYRGEVDYLSTEFHYYAGTEKNKWDRYINETSDHKKEQLIKVGQSIRDMDIAIRDTIAKTGIRDTEKQFEMWEELRMKDFKRREELLKDFINPRNWDFADKIDELLKPFFPDFNQYDFYEKYQKGHPYFQISRDLYYKFKRSEPFSFDWYVEYAKEVLK